MNQQLQFGLLSTSVILSVLLLLAFDLIEARFLAKHKHSRRVEEYIIFRLQSQIILMYFQLGPLELQFLMSVVCFNHFGKISSVVHFRWRKISSGNFTWRRYPSNFKALQQKQHTCMCYKLSIANANNNCRIIDIYYILLCTCKGKN